MIDTDSLRNNSLKIHIYKKARKRPEEKGAPFTSYFYNIKYEISSIQYHYEREWSLNIHPGPERSRQSNLAVFTIEGGLN